MFIKVIKNIKLVNWSCQSVRNKDVFPSNFSGLGPSPGLGCTNRKSGNYKKLKKKTIKLRYFSDSSSQTWIVEIPSKQIFCALIEDISWAVQTKTTVLEFFVWVQCSFCNCYPYSAVRLYNSHTVFWHVSTAATLGVLHARIPQTVVECSKTLGWEVLSTW